MAAEPREYPQTERRGFPRVFTRLGVKLQVADRYPVDCTVLDVSAGGVRVIGEPAVPVGTAVTLIMPGSVHFGGRIVRRHGATMGVAFSHEPERVIRMIADLLPSLRPE